MKVQKNNGYVATVNFTNYFDTDEQSNVRNSFFEIVTSLSKVTPLHRLDIYDETILIFNTSCQALTFLIHLTREASFGDNALIDMKLRTGLCSGDYFVYQDQIYGEAVNFATKLSFSSRENEMLVCGIDKKIMEGFTRKQYDVSYATRDQGENCFSVSLIDPDNTSTSFLSNLIFKVNYNNQRKKLKLSRYKQITIGRSANADVFIDDDKISRKHATITLNDANIFIEDHSSNGTYIYSEGNEEFLTNDSVSLCGKGQILCGHRQDLKDHSANENNIISFQLTEDTDTAANF
ncbi:MAG: FHA domain-containing protein [Gammaproteobacteria bacterium]|jgi:hypothetical protein|nr:FHA domain-containing protein [Gammaproteobacteria bacterium]MBT3725868.1 FHA domain-containing protein [Gammaproteobacteria bacterium]MBT4075755.1 FHA domain-containing protein [Gammaproteobacteria bacterium]MBT4195177.1 FHA domain-containing protein [Gammaproteobacteria bacterium]MBT4449865.1 FHA domain-containing protein [Gammaproteobacteria bacterium]